MKISINNVVPYPLKETDLSASDVWDTGITFERGYSYLVKAYSGLGKTTLLSIILGIRKDYEGIADIDGQDIKGISLAQWSSIRQNKLSYVFQGLRLFPQLTAKENLIIKNSLTQHKTEKEITELAAALKVGDLMGRKAELLSFGQQQRIAIVRALCQPFDFLLLDEPFSHLDNENIKLALELVAGECKKTGASFILTSLGNDYGFHFDKTLNL